MRIKTKIPLGQLLVERKIITAQQLDEALAEQKKSGQMLGAVLVRKGFVNEELVILSVLAEQLGVDVISLKTMKAIPEVISRLPAKAANHYKVFPVELKGNILVVATHHPLDVQTLDDLTLMTKLKIEPVLASEKEILDAIREHYGVGADTIEKMMTSKEVEEKETQVVSIDESSSEASISQFLNQILLQAHKDHATDIHIEPFEEQLRIRYRIDGILYDAQVPDNIRFFQDELLSRIKIMSNLNIAEKRLPQDGRFKVQAKDQDLDLRVSFVPTPYGETCVLRILNTAKLYSFDDLGLVGQERGYLNTLLNKPHGIIFMTGPTGSGKTTTLYTCLAEVNKEDTKIITIEDPIEYQLRGVTQIQTNAPIGLTFAHALRSVLRQDPDIIMVGEVRDAETAQITIQVALTGHLVFSTLHTNDAASGVTRLMDMGTKPYLISSSVECFIAQRLVRLVCQSCKVPVVLTEAMVKDLGAGPEQVGKGVFESKGCKECRMTGFRGRQAICEFLMMTDAIRALILKHASSQEIKALAVSQGMKTLRQHGLEKVLSGLTTPSEVLRVTHDD